MGASFKKSLLCYLLTILLLFGVVNQLLGPIKWTRNAEGTAQTDIFVGLEPGEFVSTLLLAGFRAVAVDLIWVRAMNAQEDGEWHEIVLLMNLIQQLQPRFTEAYVFNGWNMAYNISHDAEDLDEKWGWIMQGFDLLRQGARRNPNLYKVKFWAAWILYDKIGRNIDPQQRAYFTEKYMKENNGRHPLRDAALWFERAYRTPGEQLWAHRTMLINAYSFLAESYYATGKNSQLQETLGRMYLYIEQILQQEPDNEVAIKLAKQWNAYYQRIQTTEQALNQFAHKPADSAKVLEGILALWNKELEGNAYTTVPNTERARITSMLAQDAIYRLKDPKRACEFLQQAVKSLQFLTTKQFAGNKKFKEDYEQAKKLLQERHCQQGATPQKEKKRSR